MLYYLISWCGSDGAMRSHRTTSIAKAFATAMCNRKPVNLTVWVQVPTPKGDMSLPHNFVCASNNDITRAFTNLEVLAEKEESQNETTSDYVS